MEVNREKCRKLAGFGGAQYRYVAFEADGEPLGGYAFVWAQRPTAVHKGELHGYGIYDAREDEVIVEPDPKLRTEKWKQSLASAREDAAKAEETLRRIRAANSVISETI